MHRTACFALRACSASARAYEHSMASDRTPGRLDEHGRWTRVVRECNPPLPGSHSHSKPSPNKGGVAARIAALNANANANAERVKEERSK